MKNSTCSNLKSGDFIRSMYSSFVLLFFLLLGFQTSANSNTDENLEILAPPNAVACNTDIPIAITSSDYTDLTVTESITGLLSLGSIVNEDNVTDADVSNYASIISVAGVGTTYTIRVEDTTTDEYFTGGGFAGFLIENPGLLQLDLLNNTTIRTYLDGELKESSSGGALLALNTLILGSDSFYAGFYTTEDYDTIEISISSVLSVATTTFVYHAVTSSFCAGPDLEPNTPTAFVKPTFPARIVDQHTGTSGVTVGSVNDAMNAVDSNPNNYASIDLIASVLGSGSIAIKDAITDYPAGTYAGFDIETSSVLNLALLDNFTIITYLDGVQQEVRTGSSELLSLDSGLLLTGSERSQVGFVTTMPFDEVQLILNQPVSVDLGSTRVYGLVLEAFAQGELECTTPTVLNNPNHPVIINNNHTGVNGVACVACEVDNATNVISESTSDFAMINVTAGVASTASVAVENVLGVYPAGTQAGFTIRDTNDILQVDLLNSLTVTTYLDGIVQETETGSGLLALEALGLVSINPSQTNGFELVGFTTTLPYDEIQLTVGALVGAINSIEVYGSYVDKSMYIEGTVNNESAISAADGTLSVSVTGGMPPYAYSWSPGGQTSASISGLNAGTYSVTVTDSEGCESIAEFIVYTDGVQYPVPCNTEDSVAITSAGFTDLTVTESGTGLGVTNLDNIIDPDLTNYATISTTLGVGVTNSILVTDTTSGEFFEAGSYAGFLIEDSSLLQAELLNSITITTYLEGNEQETQTNTSLLALDSPILTGDEISVGFYTTENYDAVEITMSSVADLLVSTRIYYAVTNAFCAGPDLACNTATRLTKPNFPVRTVEEHTGVGGLVTLGSVNNINRAIDSNPNNYASIDLLAGVAGTASIAFKDELTDYPAETYAGFDIENASVLTTDLLDAITISTYLDGTLVESKTGGTELVPVDSGLLLTGSQSMRLGFMTTQPFDEVQLSLNQLVSLDLGSTRVYGMVLQTFCPGTINCDEPVVLSNPNDSVIINNDNTGTDGLACVACEVDNAVNAISEDTSDFALINIVAGVTGEASIAVEDVLMDYPAGTQAGFVIRDTNDLLQVDLLNTLTVTTYLDGVQQEQQTSANLLALEALGLVNITPTSTDGFYVVAFTTTTSFDQIQLSVGSLVGVINAIEVYGGYVDTTNTSFCDNARIALLKQGVFNDLDGDGCTNVNETITYTYTVTNTGTVSIENVELTDPISTDPLLLASGDTDGDGELDVDETWIYTFDYLVTQNDIDAGLVTGQATVTGVSTGGDNVSDLSDSTDILADNPTETPLCQTEDIALVKQGMINASGPNGCTEENDTIDFVFTVTNEGNTTLTAVNIIDPMVGLGTITYSSGDTDGDSELDVEETWVYTASYTITLADLTPADPSLPAAVSNQATVTASTVSGGTVSDLSDDDSVLEDDITVIDLCQNPDIALIKTAVFNDEDADGCSNVGETLTYTFTVTNQGNTGLMNITLTDDMFPNSTDITLDSGDLNDATILNVGEVWVYSATYTLTQDDIDSGSITNQATVSGESTEGDVVQDDSDDDSILQDQPTETTICQSAGIAVIKEGAFNDANSNGCSDIGETISYTFTVTNTGNVSIENVVLNDPMLGGGLTLASGNTDSDTELDVNETWIYTANYTITQSDIDAGLVSNQATLTGIGVDGTPVTDLSDNDSITEDEVTETSLCQNPAIALIKEAVFNDTNGNMCSNVGETITYTFTVTNQGNISINTVGVTDPMLANLITMVSGDTDNDMQLDVDESWVFTADYVITQSDIDVGMVSNQATVNGVGVDGTPVSDLSDNDSVLEDELTNTTLCQFSDIALIKTAVFNDTNANGCSDVGETISYTFSVTNQGNVSINTIELTDPLLGGTPLFLASGDIDADSELDVTETWVYTAEYTITQPDIDAGMVSNQATVTGIGADGTNVSDVSDDDSILEDDTTETTLCQSSAIAVIKTAMFNDANSNNCSDAGETITYTFSVTNQGNTSISTVVLNDPLLGGDVTLASGDTNSDNILDVTETWIYTADYTITQSDIDAGMVSNQATVTGIGADGTNVSDLSDDDSILEDDTTETAVCQSSAIAVIKTAVFNDTNNNGCSDAGETITYTFSVTNQGNTSISTVVLNDPLLGGDVFLASGDANSDNILDVTETWVYTADYTITQSDINTGSVSNQATVTGIGADGTNVSDLSDDDSVLEDEMTITNLCQSEGIALIKTAIFNDEDGDGCSNIGETLTYSFAVYNQGNTVIGSIVITDAMLGNQVTLASGDTDSDNELDVDETWVFTGTYVLTDLDINVGEITNQATVEGVSVITGANVADISDDDSVLEDDETVTTLCNISSIALEKMGVFNDENGSGAMQAGETITYSFIVYNTGQTTLTNITLQDDMLPGIVLEGGPIAELQPGESDSTTFTATYTIRAEDLENPTITNQATITAQDPSGNPVTDMSDDPFNTTDVDMNNNGDPDDPTVLVLPTADEADFEIFNGISPDGDGLNDFFRIEGIDNYPNNNLQIYNRWGVLVYETNGYGINGKVFTGISEGRATIRKNEELPTGTYFYILTRLLSNDDPLVNKGYLYIKRN
ncbi:DUF7507 domain-containing protein [Aestuariibaculum marinum]|uniref:Gliding motility-associated C-terminal domain-containing protein n=1 Tax=Aestuariibaculum marinum TaxID=2683592 RepID=A0A8J6PWP1_9FLAO|nr:gliding motility-associated C-terminal domain-containing protein [Aestuariibaculum marinum]MBD0825409.1 gliding motility-associated C-terminal domain-containing protein [Aestuariibaculum marinum]